MKQTIMLFVISSFIFSALIILGAWGPFNNFIVINLGILFGTFIGLLLTLTILLIQSTYLKKAGLNKAGISVVNSIEFEAAGNKEEVFAFCLESIRSIKKSEIGLINKDKGILTVNVGANWRTWGDLIQFDIKEISDQKCNVIITSRPAMSTALIDFGKNLDNIIKLINDLKLKTKINVIHNRCNIT
ncbi:hypothetical protein [Paenibacillus dakarensis]|uniref:hypothetical protein n=1 Tax=Paenibacillus dakarensis TaxID=1527293 RepID=UPI0006D56906|nr:hypothetical protein [Paenibacillus dakarensis]